MTEYVNRKGRPSCAGCHRPIALCRCPTPPPKPRRRSRLTAAERWTRAYLDSEGHPSIGGPEDR